MGDMTKLAERVARLCAEITELVAADLSEVDGGSGPNLHAEVHRSVGQLQAFAARILARVESDGRWSAGGARTFGEWEARKHTASRGAVRRQVELGRALEEALPATSAAVSRGELSLEHAQVLARRAVSSDARRAALASDDAASNEAFLLARAATRSVDDFRREVDSWAIRVDASTADAEHEAACAKEYLTFGRKGDGVALQGFVTLEHGEVLSTALRAVAGVPSQGDTRTREERQAAALVDAGRIILDRGLAGGGQQVRPHLIVHVPFDAVQRLARAEGGDGVGGFGGAEPGAVASGFGGGAPGSVASAFDGAEPATLADGVPIPPALLARLACDSSITRVVFGPDSAVLDVGRAHRTYAGQQRLAVIARDRSCRYPGCGAPPMLGEVHHVRSWRDLGETSVENGVLLCWFHHDLVHRRRIRIRRVGAEWQFRRFDGALLVEGDPGRAAAGGFGADGGSGGGGSEGGGPEDQQLAPPPAPWGGPPTVQPAEPPGVRTGASKNASRWQGQARPKSEPAPEWNPPVSPRQDTLPLRM